MTGYVIYNEKAGNGNTYKDIELMVKTMYVLHGAEYKIIEISKITNYKVFFTGLSDDDFIILCGGDGTINHFVNDTKNIHITQKIYYYSTGTGNDFAQDLGGENSENPILITQYLKDLPTVSVKGKTHHFLNAVGYGIDGYCCEVGDALKKESKEKVNYTSIAIKGLLFHYKPTIAKVTVDGKEYHYNKVWIAPTMHGRFYGGGMMAAPAQKRNNEQKELSLTLIHGAGRLRTLMVFPTIFKGKHIEHPNMVTIHTGQEITVEFDRPVALQIDGETVLDVSSYTAKAAGR